MPNGEDGWEVEWWTGCVYASRSPTSTFVPVTSVQTAAFGDLQQRRTIVVCTCVTSIMSTLTH